jgi:hypothetical protein
MLIVAHLINQSGVTHGTTGGSIDCRKNCAKVRAQKNGADFSISTVVIKHELNRDSSQVAIGFATEV